MVNSHKPAHFRERAINPQHLMESNTDLIVILRRAILCFPLVKASQKLSWVMGASVTKKLILSRERAKTKHLVSPSSYRFLTVNKYIHVHRMLMNANELLQTVMLSWSTSNRRERGGKRKRERVREREREREEREIHTIINYLSRGT